MLLSRTSVTELVNINHKRTKLSKLGATAAFAAVPIDVAASDRTFYLAQNAYSNFAHSRHMGPTAEWWFTRGATSLTIGTQALGLLALVTLSSGARDAMSGFNGYVQAKQDNMKGVRKIVSKVINSPISFLDYAGGKFEKVGRKIEERPSIFARQIGRTIIDVGQSNAMSTTGQGLYENSRSDEPIGRGRKNRISWTFASSWIGVTEGIRYGYRALSNNYVRSLTGIEYPGVDFHGALGTVGRGASELTSVYPLGAGTAFWGLVTAASLVAGNRAVNHFDELNFSQYAQMQETSFNSAA